MSTFDQIEKFYNEKKKCFHCKKIFTEKDNIGKYQCYVHTGVIRSKYSEPLELINTYTCCNIGEQTLAFKYQKIGCTAIDHRDQIQLDFNEFNKIKEWSIYIIPVEFVIKMEMIINQRSVLVKINNEKELIKYKFIKTNFPNIGLMKIDVKGFYERMIKNINFEEENEIPMEESTISFNKIFWNIKNEHEGTLKEERFYPFYLIKRINLTK